MAAIYSAPELWRVSRKLALALAYTAIAHCWAIAAVAAPLEFDVGATRLRVTVDGEGFRIGEDRVVAWVRRSAEIVAGYYGAFPVAALSVRIRSEQGRGA